MPQKSVVFLCDDANEIGGVQRVLSTLAYSFQNRGYRVLIISLALRANGGFFHEDIEKAYLFKESSALRHLQKFRLGNFHVQGRRLFRLRRLAYRRAKAALREHVEMAAPEAVIVFDTLMAKLAAESGLNGYKVLVQYHNSFESIAGTRDLERMRKVSQTVSAFCALTSVDAKHFSDAGFSRCTFVPNPVSFYPSELPAERLQQVVAIGRYHYQKAFDELVAAWSAVKRKAGWHLDIYGDGPERAKIENAIAAHGVGDSVAVHRPTANAEQVLSSASIFALSSRFEGLCMVALEALASGTPIVSTRSGPGTDELVKDCGLLSDVGDISGFAHNLQRMIDDGALRAAFSEAGRAKALKYSADHIIGRWEALIRQVEAVE